MLQKVIRVGNSLAITIPKDFASLAKFRAGQQVAVETDAAAKMLLVKSAHQANGSSLTPEFFAWLERISSRYEKVIKDLADR